MKTRLLPLALAALLSGCATNNFTQSYRDLNAGAPPSKLNESLLPYSGTTQVFGSSDFPKDTAELSRRGYLPLGESSFTWTGTVTPQQVKEQAKIVGADVVLCQDQYQGAEQGTMPVLQYNPGTTSTTYNSGQVSASGYGTVNSTYKTPTNSGYGTSNYSGYGRANYSGTSTTTTPGTLTTTLVPVTLHRYSHYASFWRKGKPRVLGVNGDNLTDDMRRALKRNTGVYVKLVVYDTPAFRANILPGDVIISIDDTPIESVAEFGPKVESFAGKECTITVLRDGKETPIKAKLNPKSL